MDGIIEKPTLDELYHQGVKGMKWGVRNGPPYPLDSKISTGRRLKNTGKSTGRRKSVTKSSSKVKKDNTKYEGIPIGLAIYLGAYATMAVFGIGAAVSAAAQSGAAKVRMKNLNKKISQLPKDSKTGLAKKDKEYTEKEDMKKVNPGYKTGEWAYAHNCALCTMTYELRRRGYETTANKTNSGISNNDFLKYFDAKPAKGVATRKASDAWGMKVKWQNESSAEKKEYAKHVISEMSKQPNGSRGTLNVQWGLGGGHSMVYEIKDNKMIIRDCQINKTYDTDAKMEKLLSTVMDTKYIRLDNAKIKPKYIKEVCH